MLPHPEAKVVVGQSKGAREPRGKVGEGADEGGARSAPTPADGRQIPKRHSPLLRANAEAWPARLSIYRARRSHRRSVRELRHRVIEGLRHLHGPASARAPQRHGINLAEVVVRTDLGTEFDGDTVRYRNDGLHGTITGLSATHRFNPPPTPTPTPTQTPPSKAATPPSNPSSSTSKPSPAPTTSSPLSPPTNTSSTSPAKTAPATAPLPPTSLLFALLTSLQKSYSRTLCFFTPKWVNICLNLPKTGRETPTGRSKRRPAGTRNGSSETQAAPAKCRGRGSLVVAAFGERRRGGFWAPQLSKNTTPGSALPSRNSREAPPPVEQ